MKILLSIALCLLCLTHTLPVFALGSGAFSGSTRFDDPPSPSASPTPDKEIDEAKRNAVLAEERKKKAEAERAEVEARRAKLKAETEAFGDPSKVSVPSGGVQTDAEGFVEVKMLSLEAARNITERLAGVLCKPIVSGNGKGRKTTNVATLVIYSESELGAVALYRSMLTQLGQFNREFADKQAEFDDLDSRTNPQTNSADPTRVNITTSNAKTNNLASETTTANIAGANNLNLNTFLGAAAIPGVATGIITSIAQLANLFRTETNFQNKGVAIPEDMVVSYLISNLNNGDLNCSNQPSIYYPHLYPAKLFSNNSDSKLLNALGEVADSKRSAADNVRKIEARIKLINDIAGTIEEKAGMEETLSLKQKTKNLLMKADPRCRKTACRNVAAEIATLKPEIEAAGTAINEATASSQAGFEKKHKGWLKSLKRLQTLTQFLIESADQVTTKLETPDEATKTTPLVQLLGAEQLASILQDNSTFMLRVAVSANGTTKIKKNVFVDAKVRHTAGANLVYQLFDHDGRVVMGDAMQYYFDYKSATDVRDAVAKGQTRDKAPSETEAAAAVFSNKRP